MKELIDERLSKIILDSLNDGSLKSHHVKLKGFPDNKCKNFLNLLSSKIKFRFKRELVEKNLKQYLDNFLDFGVFDNTKKYCIYECLDLEELGLALYPFLSFGILNGGAATSYFDLLKNKSFDKNLYYLFENKLREAKEKFSNLPKGLTPAFINKNGEFGFTFLALKLRHLLYLANKYEDRYNRKIKPSIFQMTSLRTSKYISKYLDEIFEDGLISSINNNNLSREDILTAVQPLIYCLEEENGKYKYFEYKNKDGLKQKLALPGGHGQNFRVLKDIYLTLYKQGKKFVYIGNIDNFNYTVNLKTLALMAITNCSSGFEFSLKTTVDSKGGVLVVDMDNKLTCMDIGSSISSDSIIAAESKNNKILFNCATGLFNLNYLLRNIDYIVEQIPVRLVKQSNELGDYTQIEQITWEVIRTMKHPLIFIVKKNQRFLPAKLFMEMLINSNYLSDDYVDDIIDIAKYLHEGLIYSLSHDYGLILQGEKWVI